MAEWISVKDRLPSREGLMDEENEYVLVSLRWTDGCQTVSICGYGKDEWSKWDGFGFTGNDYKHITHWMPLPEPPKEDKTDETA